MLQYSQMQQDELKALEVELTAKYEEFKAKNLKLDMSRGKPSSDQLDLSNEMMKITKYIADDGLDCRNYGGMDGLPEMKKMMADMLGVKAENIIVGGNSSLNMMFDKITSAMVSGINGQTPWGQQGKIKWLCPAPGYDRHFGVTGFYGFEMIPVAMNENGPDMDAIEELVKNDEAIKGIWCVPKYSNPQGYTYSDETVKRFANLKPKASDFRIFWDNAYCVHHLSDEKDELLDILSECEKAGNPNLAYMFASTSKISFPGAGIACMASSVENLDWDRKRINVQTIGPDKLNQLKHLEFFKDAKGIEEQMKRQAACILPKFEVVLTTLEKELAGLDILSWKKPNGGYFVSVDTLDGCAIEVVKMCKEAGVVLTNAGATYPYGKDPKDSNIRLSPTYPPVAELQIAMDLFCLCVKLVSVKKLQK